jgi:Cdc6-like AAA superfamily ATPase
MKEKIESDNLSFINPFNVLGPTNPKYFANRDDLLSTFFYNVIAVNKSRGITRPVNISITGNWGMGKTSTLLKFKDMLMSPGKDINVFSAIVHLSPECCVNSETFFLTIMEGVFREYQSTVDLPQKIRDFMRKELDIFEKWKVVLSLNPTLERKDPPPLRGIDFRYTMKTFWDKLHASGIGLVVIMLDDIQNALSSDGNADRLIDLRTNIQALTIAEARYMFIITGPSNIYPDIRDKAEPFTRIFERFDLGPFDLEGTRQLIEKPLKVEGIDLVIENDVIEMIYEITGGHPYYLNMTMREVLYRVRKGRLTMKDFKAIYPAMMEQFARVRFRDDLGRASEAEKRLLFQIAAAGDPEVSPSDFKGSGTSRMLDRLVRKDLIIKASRGKYRLYNPLFKEYLRRLDPGREY